jgi:hypothetical protein
MPDYDGRGNAEQSDEPWQLWLPRVVLAPLYAVHEYVVRRPLGAIASVAERDRWPARVVDALTFGPDGKYLVLPSAFYDFGLRPSVGLDLSMADVLAPGNHLGFHAATGGTEFLSATVSDRYQLDDHTAFTAQAGLQRRGDDLILGIGPDVTDATKARYGLQRIDAVVAASHDRGPALVRLAAGVRRTSFRRGVSSDPVLDDMPEIAPPGYGRAYTAFYQRTELVLDSRAPRPGRRSGVVLQLYAEPHVALGQAPSWLVSGGALAGSADLGRPHRTFKLQVAASFVDPLRAGRGDAIPFTELATLGGDLLMPGFVKGWMTGRSTIASQLSYTWPIWLWLDGELRLSAGNAFGAQLTGFAPEKLRLSSAIGITTVGPRDAGFELVLGLGTETFEQGGDITSVRIAFGSRGGL